MRHLTSLASSLPASLGLTDLPDGWHALPCGGVVETRQGRPVAVADGASSDRAGASTLAQRLDVEALTGYEISPRDDWREHGPELKASVFAWCSVCEGEADARRPTSKCRGRFGHLGLADALRVQRERTARAGLSRVLYGARGRA